VDRRITQVKADRRLEREMQDFQEDQALFGEEGRILSVTRTKTESAPGLYTDKTDGDGKRHEGEPGPPDPTDDIDADDHADPGEDGIVGGGAWGNECYGGQCGTPGLDEPATVEVEVTSTQEGQVPMGVDAGEGDAVAMSPAKRVKWLKKRRAQIVEQIKKLQILHDRIQEKAEQIEEE
jgi:hypothetical protein